MLFFKYCSQSFTIFFRKISLFFHVFVKKNSVQKAKIVSTVFFVVPMYSGCLVMCIVRRVVEGQFQYYRT